MKTCLCIKGEINVGLFAHQRQVLDEILWEKFHAITDQEERETLEGIQNLLDAIWDENFAKEDEQP